MSAYGLPDQPITYGQGAGWLPFVNERDQLLASLYNSQGQLGSNILGSLLKLASDPAAGPLGLLASGAFGGGAQNIAAGTGGKGIASPYSGLLDRLLTGLSQSVMNPGSPFNPDNGGQYNTGAAGVPKIDPNKAPMMTPESAAAAPNQAVDWTKAWNTYNPNDQKPIPGAALGAGITLGGQPHFITDAAGNQVAKLTEDGKPEHIAGVGVEVTPLDPVRRAQYESSKQFGSMFGEMTGRMLPQRDFATGGTALFPDIAGSKVDSEGPGSQMLPTSGGPAGSRADQVGSYFKSTLDPTTGKFSMPGEATDATSANDPAGYAKMLGGALSADNTAVDSGALKSLNAGLAPSKLFSAQVLGSMSPSQQKSYLALLQSMGLGSPEDTLDMIRKGRPDAMI